MQEFEKPVRLGLELQGVDFVSPSDELPKSAQRIRFDAEVEAIRKRFGGLDDMRTKLGLSRRRMCEFLLVDASAWTRWTSGEGEEQAPAHVYKTMSLLMEKYENQPEAMLKSQSIGKDEIKRLEAEIRRELLQSRGDIKTDVEHRVRHILEDYSGDVEHRVSSQFERLKNMLHSHSELGLGWKLLILLNLIASLYLIAF